MPLDRRPCAAALTLVLALLPAACGWSPGTGAGTPRPPKPPASGSPPAGGSSVRNDVFGYRVPVPAGWRAVATDGKPLDQSASLVLAPASGTAAADGPAIDVRVCNRDGSPCTQPDGARIVSATKAQGNLAGVPATLFHWQLQAHASAHSAAETGLVVFARHGFTYALILKLPAGEASPPPAWAAVRDGWSWLTPAAARAPTAPVQRLHMVDGSIGWGFDGATLLRTTDGGVTWAAVTPPGMARGAAADFAGAERAWIAWGTAAQPFAVEVARTSDGGRTWKTAEVMRNGRGARFFVDALTFVDARHGWLTAIPSHGMNSSPGALYATSDGGRTWHQVAATGPGGPPASLPFGGPVVFRALGHGWLSGARASTLPDELYATSDGGRTWTRVRLPVPAGYGQVSAGLPRRLRSGSASAWRLTAALEGRHGVVLATGVYTSRDGGQTWSGPQVLHHGAYFFDLAHGYGWDASRGVLQVTADGGVRWRAIHSRTLAQALANRSVLQIDFVSPSRGWLLAGNSDGTVLLSTADGGRTWSFVHARVVGHH